MAGARLTIDLGGVARNYRLLARACGDAACAAVVKANAYGLGVDRVALALHDAECRIFFVATIDEALELRAILSATERDAEIFALNGAPASLANLVHAERIIPVLNASQDVRQWREVAMAVSHTPLVAIHVDTAMNRLGLDYDEANELIGAQTTGSDIQIRAILSHLACADESGHPLNQLQREKFCEVCRAAPNAQRSLANSSGVYLGPDFHFEMVRVGVALYGVNPTPERTNPMSEVVNLKGKIAQTRQIDRGMTVGYGAAFTAARPMRLATVPVGYADGYPRALSNRGVGEIGGIRVPVVGRVSMDLTVFDVTDVAPEAACVGNEIRMIGGEITLDDVAGASDTIAYEILVRLGQRFNREYLSGSSAQ